MTATIPEFDTLLDHDFDLPCETIHWVEGCKGSGRPARWIIFKRCCSLRGLLVCELCKNYVTDTEDAIQCGENCRTVYQPARHIIRLIEALNGGKS